LKERFDRTALVHRLVALRNFIEREDQIEHVPGIDPSIPNELDQVRKIPAHWSGAAMQADVGKEELLSV